MSTARAGGAWSADRNWYWDGVQWNDAISPDGKWRFDGSSWKPFSGNRTLMPAEPLRTAVEVSAGRLPVPDMPDWVAQSEVVRLDEERRERDRQNAIAAHLMPPPPEQDWRRVGEHMSYSGAPRRLYAWWQLGLESVLIFGLLYLMCAPLSFVFIWRTGWRPLTKILVATGSLLGPVIIGFLALGTGMGRRA